MACAELTFEDLLKVVENGDPQQLSWTLQQPSVALNTESVLVDAQTGVRIRKLNLERLIGAAARSGREDMVEALLQFGESHNVPVSQMINMDTLADALHKKPLEVLLKFSVVDPKAFNRPHHIGADLFDMACCGGPSGDEAPRGKYFGLLRYLLENGANPNKKVRRKQPGFLLRWACWSASRDIVECLLQYGATVKGSGALHLACVDGRVDLLELLLEHGGDVNEVCEENDILDLPGTALEIAIAQGHENATQWLIDHGAMKS